MATFTISVNCATDLYTNNFCLIYGESDCQTLCDAFSNACD